MWMMYLVLAVTFIFIMRAVWLGIENENRSQDEHEPGADGWR